MKTEIEIREFLKEKTFNQEDTRTIRAIIKAKNYNGINVVNGGVPNSKLIDFLDWFESETKEDNQDTIIFEGKEYEFVETNSVSCIGCDLSNKVKCNTIPCATSNRKDKRGGIFKLKTIQEQKLELIPNEFYTVKIDDVIIDTLIFEGTTQDMLCFGYSISFQGRNKNTLWTGYDENIKYARSYQLATPEEKQKLINAVEKQENKRWDEQTKTFENKPKDILVPESIKIILFRKANRLGLLFDKNNKTLFYNRLGEDYNVTAFFSSYQEIISCKLVPTLFSEIKAGDIYIECGLNQLNPSCYHIKLHGKEYAKIDGKKDIQVCSDLPDKNQNVYKVIPCQQ